MTSSTNSTTPILAAVEGGGTSFILTVASLNPKPPPITSITPNTIPHTPFQILHRTTVPSSDPQTTLSTTAEFFRCHRPPHGYAALGIATFGPVGLDPTRPRKYGRILPGSPKREWRDVDILTPVLRACSSEDGCVVPVHRIDTDVNAPAMAEFRHRNEIDEGRAEGGSGTDGGIRRPLSSLAYITVGTGIGVGLIVNSRPVHGMMHPEGGHVPIVPLPGSDSGIGYSWGDRSPFGGRNTVEGTASSVALTDRLAASNAPPSGTEGGTVTEKASEAMSAAEEREGLRDLPDDHAVWDHAANALANLCTTLTLVLSVEKIVMGGGVMNRAGLLEKVRIRTRGLLNGYLDLPQVTTDEGLREFIGASVWSEAEGGVGAGLVGALVLAQTAYEGSIAV